MSTTIESSGCSIVLIGAFNPAIFHPAWLSGNNIDLKASLDSPEVNLIHAEFSSFTVDTRTYHIRPDRFQIETSSAPWIEIYDITRLIFEDYLLHTPIGAFGINRNLHYSVADWKTRVQFGRLLAPIGPWGQFGDAMETRDPQLTGGLQKLVMRRQSRIQEARLETNVNIEPSVRTPDPTTGVYIEVNAHHDLLDLPSGYGSAQAMELLGRRFDQTIDEADTIMEYMMKQGAGL